MKREFTVYAEPYGKVNMKPVFMNGHQSLVQPESNSNYMTLVKNAYIGSLVRYYSNFVPSAEELMFSEDAQLNLQIIAYFSIPKAYSKKKREKALRGELNPIKRPDCDNISKIICDALNKLAFRDDSQIVKLIVEKHYSDVPRIEVKISDEME